MRILYTITFLHFGAGRSLVELACEAKKQGHEPHIVATRKIDRFESQENLVEEARAAGVPVLLVPDLFTRDMARIGASAESIAEIFRAGAFDLIHSHAAIPGFAANLAARQAHGRWLPHISTVQGWSRDKPAWMKLQDVTFLNTVTVVHAVSNDMKRFLISEGVQESRIRMMYFGCDFQRLDTLAAAVPAAAARPAKFRIGAVSERKGVHFLLEAVAHLPEKVAGDLEVFIAGDGPDKGRLEQLAQRLGIEEKIHWLGYLRNPYPMMRQFDLFVLPSMSEGLPVTLVEAMYLKIPVLATDVQGSGEIGGEGRAVLVPARDSRKLALAIQGMYWDRDGSRRRAEAAYGWVTQNFDRCACFGTMIELYRWAACAGA
jgi:glycosyltransferase involved in cell wall biosynthesis